MTTRPLGPNMKKFIFRKMISDAIPEGGGFAAGLKFLTTKGAMSAGWAQSVKWCDAAILAVRNAAEPNPWKDADEETIAGELVRKIGERDRAVRG